MESQNKLSCKTRSSKTIANTAVTTSASTNSTTASNFAVTTTTASIVSVTTTTASIVSVTTSTASNFVAATDHPRQGRGFIPGLGQLRNHGGIRGFSLREIERRMGGSSDHRLLVKLINITIYFNACTYLPFNYRLLSSDNKLINEI